MSKHCCSARNQTPTAPVCGVRKRKRRPCFRSRVPTTRPLSKPTAFPSVSACSPFDPECARGDGARHPAYCARLYPRPLGDIPPGTPNVCALVGIHVGLVVRAGCTDPSLLMSAPSCPLPVTVDVRVERPCGTPGVLAVVRSRVGGGQVHWFAARVATLRDAAGVAEHAAPFLDAFPDRHAAAAVAVAFLATCAVMQGCATPASPLRASISAQLSSLELALSLVERHWWRTLLQSVPKHQKSPVESAAAAMLRNNSAIASDAAWCAPSFYTKTGTPCWSGVPDDHAVPVFAAHRYLITE